MNLSQQPKKRSHMDDSSSWDIVKASQFGFWNFALSCWKPAMTSDIRTKITLFLLHLAAIKQASPIWLSYSGAFGSVGLAAVLRSVLKRFSPSSPDRYYISKGAIVDQLGGDLSSTPLHWAIRQGHLSMVIQLLRYGADPSIADGEGYRALHLAILFQHMAIAAYLMAKGQDVDEQDANGQTPVMLAALK
ncbi:unnamed protein product, partial [Tetraodon nigroviridis]